MQDRGVREPQGCIHSPISFSLCLPQIITRSESLFYLICAVKNAISLTLSTTGGAISRFVKKGQECFRTFGYNSQPPNHVLELFTLSILSWITIRLIHRVRKGEESTKYGHESTKRGSRSVHRKDEIVLIGSWHDKMSNFPATEIYSLAVTNGLVVSDASV